MQKLERSRQSFEEKITSLHIRTRQSYKTVLNNLENFCMEKYGKIDFVADLKKLDDDALWDFLQAWINWNAKLNPVSVKTMFPKIKRYFYYRGIKLAPQDIKENLTFARISKNELYGVTLDDLQKILSELGYKDKTLFLCQLSSAMRIGELVQLKPKHLILDKDRIIVKIPTTIAKFSKARTTFFSSEAGKMLKSILKKLDDDDLIFGTNKNPHYSEINKEQVFRRVLIKCGLDMRYEHTNRFKINTHSLRAYFITKISRHDHNFAHFIAGQESKIYQSQYDRLTDDEKLQKYIEIEPDLLIFDQSRKNHEFKKHQNVTNSKIADLEDKLSKVTHKLELVMETFSSSSKV